MVIAHLLLQRDAFPEEIEGEVSAAECPLEFRAERGLGGEVGVEFPRGLIKGFGDGDIAADAGNGEIGSESGSTIRGAGLGRGVSQAVGRLTGRGNVPKVGNERSPPVMARIDQILFPRLPALALLLSVLALPPAACAQLFGKKRTETAKIREDGKFRLGIDVLRERAFDLIEGKRVGLITNQSGVDGSGEKTRLVLHAAKNVKLTALYTPEHGLDGTEKAGIYVASRRDEATGVMAFSIFGKTRKPSPEMLEGVDVLVFDIQDVGARCYTYVSTMGLCMEAAAEAGIEFVVLDRPNPLGGARVEGPPIEKRWQSFVGQYPVPFVHGMTTGELARMIVGEKWIKAVPKLTVVPMTGWRRGMLWRDTSLKWTPTSPNIPKADSPTFYIATGILGHLPAADVGTETAIPFEYATAKGVNAGAFAKKMGGLGFDGVRFSPYQSAKKKGWAGCRIEIDPRSEVNLAALDVTLVCELHRAMGGAGLLEGAGKGSLDLFRKVYGSTHLDEALKGGADAAKIIVSWESSVKDFRKARAPYLLYR